MKFVAKDFLLDRSQCFNVPIIEEPDDSDAIFSKSQITEKKTALLAKTKNFKMAGLTAALTCGPGVSQTRLPGD